VQLRALANNARDARSCHGDEHRPLRVPRRAAAFVEGAGVAHDAILECAGNHVGRMAAHEQLPRERGGEDLKPSLRAVGPAKHPRELVCQPMRSDRREDEGRGQHVAVLPHGRPLALRAALLRARRAALDLIWRASLGFT